MNSDKPRIGVVFTTNGDRDEVESFLDHHRRLGIGRFFLYPDGDSRERLQSLDQIPGVIVAEPEACSRNPSVQGRQIEHATHAFRVAANDKLDWLFHIDTDERLWARTDIGSLFLAVPQSVDVVRLPTLEAVSDRFEYDDPFREIRFFFAMPLPMTSGRIKPFREVFEWTAFILRLYMARVLGVKVPSWRHLNLGHHSGKSAVRVGARITHMGNHVPQAQSGVKLVHRRVRGSWLLHYDGCAYPVWNAKLDRWCRNAETLLAPNPIRRRLISDYADCLLSDDPEACKRSLFGETRMRSGRDMTILRKLGLIKEIETTTTI